MKKTIYTIAFVALFSVVSNAQTTDKKTQSTPAKKEVVNPDGTISTAPAHAPAAAEPAQTDNVAPAPNTAPKNGTRMAITEKGVPASKKPTEAKKAEPAKTEKH